MMPTALFESCTSSAIALPGSSSSVTQSKTRQKLHGWTVASHGKFALQKSCAGLHMSEWFRKWYGNGHEWTALPLTPSWPFMPSFSSSVRQYSSRTPRPCAQWAVQSCAPLQQGPSGREIHLVFGTKGFGEWKIFVALQYPCTHGGIAVSCFTHELPVLPQKQFAILLHLMYCLCKTCLANSNFPELEHPLPSTLGNTAKHAHAELFPCPLFDLLPIFEWQGQRLLLQRELWTSFWYRPCIGAMVVWHVQISHVGLAFISEASNVESQHYSTL